VLTLVVYHYVRDVGRSAFPGIKARSCAEFERQLDHVERNYVVIRLGQVVEAYSGGAPLPANACLLTFDDGLADHVQTVLPALRRRGLTGCFCVPGRLLEEPVVLDVQKSQFLLAAVDDHAALGSLLLDLLVPLRDEHGLPPAGELRTTYERPGRYDAGETTFVKRLLQDGLPEEPRRQVLDRLFAEYVTKDEAGFARSLYLSRDGLRSLAEGGMDLAGHGWAHRRLALLDEAEQRQEVERTAAFLASAGVARANWTMCYPYGSRDETTLALLTETGFALGFRDRGGIAGPDDEPLDLPRIDTNELPVG
jgi:peptidoglycan/xylan/chitin deacetylase (PgdA/CDA1 family)